MTGTEYRTARQQRGTQKSVALALGVDYRTIQRREAGDVPITREACLALCALPLRKTKKRPTQKGQNDKVSGRLAETNKEETTNE